VSSPAYHLFTRAMIERQQIHCRYNGRPRELCPIILGHKKGEEVALVYQVGGESNSDLAPDGQWKCLHLAKVEDARLGAGPWHAGSSHQRPQSCVDEVDIDVNPDSPYKPR
jgi:hypothetical protein